VNPVSFPIKIVGTGIALPGRMVQSNELETTQGWEPGYLQEHTGVSQRYWALPEESVGSLGARALQAALDDASIGYNDLGLVICGSATFDYPIPHTACRIQYAMGTGLKPVPGWDIDATCLGFITALDVASRLLDGNRYKRIAIVCSEICSRSLNPADMETYGLLADGAFAIIAEKPAECTQGIVAAHMQTWPEAALMAMVPAGGAANLGLNNPPLTDHYFRMDGRHLLTLALKHLKPFTEALLADADAQIADLAAIVPHQASLNGIKGFVRLMAIEESKIVVNIERFGNTLSASVGIALHESLKNGRIRSGDTIMLLGTGAGFSIGGLILTI
jgi:3-oxoacyl-[acyl-carrier-protein] synthase-3